MKNEEDKKVEGGDVDVAPSSPAAFYPDYSGASMKAHPHPPHIMNVFQHPHTEPRGCVCSCIHNSSSSAYIQTINTAANVEVSSYNGCHSAAIM